MDIIGALLALIVIYSLGHMAWLVLGQTLKIGCKFFLGIMALIALAIAASLIELSHV